MNKKIRPYQNQKFEGVYELWIQKNGLYVNYIGASGDIFERIKEHILGIKSKNIHNTTSELFLKKSLELGLSYKSINIRILFIQASSPYTYDQILSLESEYIATFKNLANENPKKYFNCNLIQ